MKKLRFVTKILLLILCCCVLTALVGCENGDPSTDPPTGKTIDINMSEMSDTMAYSTMVNVLNDSEGNVGKRIKATGVYDVQNGCHWLVLRDEQQCCSIGMEFLLDGAQPYPGLGSTITISGVFGQYTESGVQHFFLLVDEFAV